jgi:cytochrome b561
MAAHLSSQSSNENTEKPWRYTAPAIVMHWLLAALIILMLALGWYMMTVEKSPSGPFYFDLHRSIGLVVGALVLLRVLWRLFHSPRPLPASLRSKLGD